MQSILLPLFHSFKGLNDYSDELCDLFDDYWKIYMEVNEFFAKEICQFMKDDP
jgi:trehalose-6-phosphate synthase